MQLFSCQHREQHISKRNFEITAVILWKRFIFPDWHYKDGPLNFYIFPPTKTKNLLWKHLLTKIKYLLIFVKQLCMLVQYGFLYLILTRPKFTVYQIFRPTRPNFSYFFLAKNNFSRGFFSSSKFSTSCHLLCPLNL